MGVVDTVEMQPGAPPAEREMLEPEAVQPFASTGSGFGSGGSTESSSNAGASGLASGPFPGWV
jgi:hypothetical protein